MVGNLNPPKDAGGPLESVVSKEIAGAAPAELKSMAYLQIEVPQKDAPSGEYVKRQCSPGDMLVASPWKTY